MKIINSNHAFCSSRFSQSANPVQLASTKRTRYKELPVESMRLGEVYHQRSPAPIMYLRQTGYEALYGEVDVVGLVTSVSSSVRNR